MKSKFLGGGLLFLSDISLISVGFSAWSISTVGSAEAEIKVNVEDVVNLNEVFQIQKPIMFQYGPYGIIRNETIVSDGYVYFPVLIKTTHQDYPKIKKNDDGNLSFSLSISNVGNFDIFNSSYLARETDGRVTSTYSASNATFSNECGISVSSTIDSNTITTNLSLDNGNNILGKDVYFNLALHFKFDDFSSVYSALSSSGLSFSIKVKADVL